MIDLSGRSHPKEEDQLHVNGEASEENCCDSQTRQRHVTSQHLYDQLNKRTEESVILKKKKQNYPD